MEYTSNQYINVWTKALQAEIAHLKKYGSTKYILLNGRKMSGFEEETYYFESRQPINIPAGSTIKLQWGKKTAEGRILSSEGKGIILEISESLGDLVTEAYLIYDPWQLLDELASRLSDIKKSKLKRARIKRLMEPNMPSKHVAKENETHVKELYSRSKVNPVTYVWGPPGTGKTYTLARVAANKYLHNKSVLVLSHSNAAVNVLMSEIYFFLEKMNRFKEGDLIRYGAQQDAAVPAQMTINYLLEQSDPSLIQQKNDIVHDKQMLKHDLQQSFSNRDSQKLLKLETKLAGLMEKMKRKEQHLLKDAKVIGTTLARAAMDASIYEHQYDLAIVDEASMCYVPQVALASSLAKRIIICGDFKQLPPIAQSKHPDVIEWLKEDIFHKSGVADTVQQRSLHQHLLLLDEQRRMHPDISSFTNKHIYHSLVHDHPKMRANTDEIVQRPPFAGEASILLDTSFTGHYCLNDRSSKSRWNPWHLFLAFQCMHEAYLAGAGSIGYATPYRIQAQLMNDLLTELYPNERDAGLFLAATVHKFQGSEKEVMVFDSVDAWPFDKPGYLLAGKDSERLINVAITRTKGKFIHIVNRDYTSRKTGRMKTHRRLVEHQLSAGKQVTHQKIGMWAKNHHPIIRFIHAIKEDQLLKEISSAKREIILCLPKEHQLSQGWIGAIEASNVQDVKILSDLPSEMEIGDPYFAEMSFPFTIIDRKILWLGQPFGQSKGILPPLVAVRAETPLFINQFLSRLPIEGLS
ncbi:DEAD/DEAH box helicase [Bacillus sp. 1P06AnD]|uniref:DEAD/DEAH box helicase n=1 Tax=Bacillus sp. 1P06AnD TaxID=3132208 RepID=UPI0039A08582